MTNGDCSSSIVDALNNRANCDNDISAVDSTASRGAAGGQADSSAVVTENGLNDDDEYEDEEEDDEDGVEEDNDDDDDDDDNGNNGEESSGRRRRRSGGMLSRTRRLKIKTNPPASSVAKSAKKNKNAKKELAVRNWTVGSEICVEVRLHLN